MSKEFFGDVCAHCPPQGSREKAMYPRIGSAFKDGDRISLKLDCLPLDSAGWSGWVNIFPRDLSDHNPRAKPKSALQELMDDDIPF